MDDEPERLVVADPEYFDGETASAQWLKSALANKGVDVLVLNCCWSAQGFLTHSLREIMSYLCRHLKSLY